MEIIDIEQGTPEWFRQKIGSIGGSSIAAAVPSVTNREGSFSSCTAIKRVGKVVMGSKTASASFQMPDKTVVTATFPKNATTINEQRKALFETLTKSGRIGLIDSVVKPPEQKTRQQLLYRKAGEILSNEVYVGYSNDNMARGIEQEPEAREIYSFLTDTEVTQVGMFRYSEHEHFSPDGYIESGGGILEIKSVIPSVHIETICSGRVPAQYRKQVQWGLREQDWCDFISYSPLVVDNPIWIKRVKRDAKLIETLIDGAAKFVEEMIVIVEKIRVK